jgi:hypothetical protein
MATYHNIMIHYRRSLLVRADPRPSRLPGRDSGCVTRTSVNLNHIDNAQQLAPKRTCLLSTAEIPFPSARLVANSCDLGILSGVTGPTLPPDCDSSQR